MTHFRGFSSSDEFSPVVRAIDSDAPAGMRQELIDLVFHLTEANPPLLKDERMHKVICQSLGVGASGQPYGGFRYAAGRDLAKADWRRVFDLICRLWPDLVSAGLTNQYHQGVNSILAANGVVWELTEHGRLQRHLPAPAVTLITAVITELKAPHFAPAFTLLNNAKDAFDDRPRRDRDACANIFDSMESVAKTVFSRPTSTFGAVLTQIRARNALQSEIISVLESINTLRNRKFGHGMTVPFDLSSGEVDFTYLTCIGAILLFVKI